MLNAYQKNSLRTTLLGLEETLRRAQEWLDGRQDAGILYRESLETAEEQKKRAEGEIKKALETVARLAERFELETETRDAANEIRAGLNVSWANLLDSRSQKLGRYGKVSPQLADALDPEIQELAEAALRLASLFEKAK